MSPVCYYLLTGFDNDVCIDRFIFIWIIIKSLITLSVPVLQTSDEDNGLCFYAAFSPVDLNVIASACNEWGIKLFDIRQDLFRYLEKRNK